VRQKKEVFFIGADPKVRNFTGALRRLRFGPDVFADALVPRRRVVAARALISETLNVDLPSCSVPRMLREPRRASRRGALLSRAVTEPSAWCGPGSAVHRQETLHRVRDTMFLRRCADGYRFAKRQGKPNSAKPAVIQ
jgi:hypothetical protein